ncbi:dissimilatory nitrite reductase (NO-forming) cytochrome cd1 type apoprotein [Aquimarina sp. MAR_2010_214]|uniref:nitrite reductase n=1 Tax=Aquimarina sp. MAR_2010_214 TaxID=1250026 RepID=UPI000C704F4E|nr:nitrite reductase [Aquimarina sp. MAR_2010_214]PKV51032.1 dissimilatory nitrite reductase (NO-forming) cytochrome cd1 type apoprotein [Aquimarina sp. MAR_2010_214]
MKNLKLNVLCIALLAIAVSCKSDKKGGEPDYSKKVDTETTKGIQISDAEIERGSQIYFDKCAGCHGSSRKGATGPSLLPDGDGKYVSMKNLGTAGIRTFIENGTPSGMPEWKGILPENDIELLTRFLQVDPPAIPPYGIGEIKASWKLIVPVADRPTKPEHKRNIDNYFGVIMRDAGKVAIIDGDTKEKLAVLKTGFAVHILRTSASGRYIYSVGRDGRITMIDTYTETPTIVAEVKGGFDARSVEVSKYKGFEDKYLVFGGYSPSHIAILDAQTLEPLSVTTTSGNACDGEKEFIEEARVASIVASHTDPVWICNVKETGMVWIVDYTDPRKPEMTQIPSARFLHDGGWDSTGHYFLVAANASNKIVVIDVPNKKLVKIIETGIKPHPGRGTNIKNKLGNLWVTSHLGENKLSFIKTNPGEGQWTVVKEAKAPGSGGGALFVKSHPKSKNLWVDRTLNPDAKLNSVVDVFDTNTLELKKTLPAPEGVNGRAVHMEYNKAGNEVWVSYFMGEKSAVVIYNDKTLKVKQIIQGDWVENPTGKFNVYNTTHDIY